MASRKNRGRNQSSLHSRRPGASKRRRQKQLAKRAILFLSLLLAVILVLIFWNSRTSLRSKKGGESSEGSEEDWIGAPELNVDLLDVNEYSRPGTPLEEVKGIVIHYTANPGTGAKANRDYFEGLKDTHTTKASSHFIVGLEGEIIQCIPSTEISYASNERNVDTLSIECCHPDETGQFQDNTYRSMVDLTGWLCSRYGLTSEDVIRHYDVTGKLCPKYFVENEAAWTQFRADVDQKIAEIQEMRS